MLVAVEAGLAAFAGLVGLAGFLAAIGLSKVRLLRTAALFRIPLDLGLIVKISFVVIKISWFN